MESIKKLNEGLNLIELQSDERGRKFEQVVSAEIKSRKQKEKDMNERLESYNQKFTYAIQSFQSTVGNLSNRLNDHKDTVNRSILFVSVPCSVSAPCQPKSSPTNQPTL